MWEGNLQNETARRCLYLVAKHAPRIMAVEMAVEAAEREEKERKASDMTRQQKLLMRWRETQSRRRAELYARETPEQREERRRIQRERTAATRAKQKGLYAKV